MDAHLANLTALFPATVALPLPPPTPQLASPPPSASSGHASANPDLTQFVAAFKEMASRLDEEGAQVRMLYSRVPVCVRADAAHMTPRPLLPHRTCSLGPRSSCPPSRL